MIVDKQNHSEVYDYTFLKPFFVGIVCADLTPCVVALLPWC